MSEAGRCMPLPVWSQLHLVSAGRLSWSATHLDRHGAVYQRLAAAGVAVEEGQGEIVPAGLKRSRYREVPGLCAATGWQEDNLTSRRAAWCTARAERQ